jgi:penicillin-binding protein 1A
MKNFILKNLKIVLFLASIVATILIGALIGIIFVYQKGFPQQIERLEDLTPKILTSVYDDQNGPIKEFAIEKRTVVKSSDIPDTLKQAIIAGEDNQFYSHWGINFIGTFRAVLGEIFGKNWGGGSSITQQLARGLFLTPERTYSRKLKEMLLAIQIEKNYSKDQILAFYCNRIFWGGSVYGAESASRYYFGKPVRDIALPEAALLAAVIPSPNILYNMLKKPEESGDKREYLANKRDHILNTMRELAFIDQKQCEEALKADIPKKPADADKESIGDYFLEETRKYIEAKFGDNLLYQGGLKVYTTLNSEMQKWAEYALREGLRELDKRRGWRNENKLFNVLENNIKIEDYQPPEWRYLTLAPNEIVKGIVLKISNKRAFVKVKGYRGRLDDSDTAWTKLPLSRILKKGDVPLLRILEVDEEKKELKLGLEQEPDTQGAILVVENRTGEIKAMVGGYSFEKYKFNNATQALRQTGSAFKPIIYTAALENGYTPATLIVDEPYAYYDEKIDEVWEPQNDQGDFIGPLTLRSALQQSRNVVSAKIVTHLTPQKIVDYARKFGITSDLKPFMSIALGTFEVRLIEMVSAFTVFPNLGIRVNPYFVKAIRDQYGHIIEENYPDRKRVIEPDTAFIMNNLLQGVVRMGTGWRARHLTREYNVPIGGKTGTTDGCTNAWFIGFCPSVTVGVWVGFDKGLMSLGKDETGSRAANPIFARFMEQYLEKCHEQEPEYFKKPPGIVWVEIDRLTGKLLAPHCLYPFKDAFLTGTEPMEPCSEEDHFNITDYFGSGGDIDPEGQVELQRQSEQQQKEGEKKEGEG